MITGQWQVAGLKAGDFPLTPSCTLVKNSSPIYNISRCLIYVLSFFLENYVHLAPWGLMRRCKDFGLKHTRRAQTLCYLPVVYFNAWYILLNPASPPQLVFRSLCTTFRPPSKSLSGPLQTWIVWPYVAICSPLVTIKLKDQWVRHQGPI